MTPTLDAQVIDNGRFAWRATSLAASGIAAASRPVEELANRLPTLLGALQTPEAAAVAPSARQAAARELATEAARLRHAAVRLQVAAASLIETNEVHHADATSTARIWTAHHSGLSRGAAAELCRAAETCERFTQVGQAFYTGDITLAHVDAVARIIPARFRGDQLTEAIDKIQGVEDVIVDTARSTDIEEFAEFCGRIRDRLDTDGPNNPGAEPSRIWLHRLFNGRWSLSGDLSPDDGAILATILAELRARRRNETANTSGRPHDDRSPAGAPEPSEEPAEADDPLAPTYGEQQAGDLIDLVMAGAGTDRPGRVGLFLHIDLNDLNTSNPDNTDAALTDLLAGRRPAHTEAGLDITDDTLWALMADADITPVFNRNGTSLSYGRTRRLAPSILRRVIAHRDRRCRFDGCRRSAEGCHVHHVVHWDDGGETDPSNSASECPYHHLNAHHARKFDITGDADGELTITRPDGTAFDATPLYRRSA